MGECGAEYIIDGQIVKKKQMAQSGVEQRK